MIEAEAAWSPVDQKGMLFLFPKEGGGQFTSPSMTLRIRPGDVLILGETCRGSLTAHDGKRLNLAYFSANLDHFFPLLATHEIPTLEHITSELRRPKWLGATHPIAAECHRLIAEATPEMTLRHRGQLLRVAAALLSNEFTAAQTKQIANKSPDLNMVQVFEKLSVDELLSLSVEELAERCNCSRRHLSRLFHQHFRFSVGALKMEIRLLKAVSLLRNPSAKMIHVAMDCGFNHQGLFNTCFKRRFGVSPGELRKQLAATNKTSTNFDAALPLAGCQQLVNGLCPLALRPDSCNFTLTTIVKQASQA